VQINVKKAKTLSDSRYILYVLIYIIMYKSCSDKKIKKVLHSESVIMLGRGEGGVMVFVLTDKRLE